MSKHHKQQLSSRTLDALTLEDGALFHSGKGAPVEMPAPLAPLADSHGHLTHFREHDPAEELARAAVAGVRLLVVPLDSVGDARDARAVLDDLSRWQEELPERLHELRETAGLVPRDVAGFECRDGLDWPLDLRIVGGVHPYGALLLDDEAQRQLEILLADERCVGVGEFGLDVGPWSELPLEVQEPAFRQQLRLAHAHGLPVELHLRDEEDGVHASAHDLTLRILEEEGVPEAGCDLHCFTSDAQVMQPFVELGCHIAFGGAATFGRSADIREAAARCPAGRILSETDSPYMAPVPLRGQECEPAMIAFSAACVAQARAEAGVATAAETYRSLWENALAFFNL